MGATLPTICFGYDMVKTTTAAICPRLPLLMCHCPQSAWVATWLHKAVILCCDITIWVTHVICLRHFDWLLVRLQRKCGSKLQWHVEIIIMT
jgi:hypothetical protein